MKNRMPDSGLKSVMNFRDAMDLPGNSGSKPKRGLIFRSASVDRISRKDIEQLKSLGIKTIIDLRAPHEYSKRKVFIPEMNRLSLPLDFEKVTRERLKPLIMKKNQEEAVQKVINELYIEILDAAKPVLNEIAKIILTSGKTPLLIHCRAGKDRTGIVCALLQMIAGAGRESIVENFMKSNDYLLPVFRKRLKLRKILSFGIFPSKEILDAITLRKENIEQVLERVENHYGGIKGYLSQAGFDLNEYEALRRKFTDD